MVDRAIAPKGTMVSRCLLPVGCLLLALLQACRTLPPQPDAARQARIAALAEKGYPVNADFNAVTLQQALGVAPFTPPVGGFALRVTLQPAFEAESVFEIRLEKGKATVSMRRFDLCLWYYVMDAEAGDVVKEGTGGLVRPPEMLTEQSAVPPAAVRHLQNRLDALNAAAMPFADPDACDGIGIDLQWSKDAGARSLAYRTPCYLADARYELLIEEVLLVLDAATWSKGTATYLGFIARDYLGFGTVHWAGRRILRPCGARYVVEPPRRPRRRFRAIVEGKLGESYSALDMRYVSRVQAPWAAWFREFIRRPTVCFVVDAESAKILDGVGVDRALMFRSPEGALRHIQRLYMADWRAADPSHRLKMLNRKMMNSVLVGSTRGKALALLGPPGDLDVRSWIGPEDGLEASVSLRYLLLGDGELLGMTVVIDAVRDRVKKIDYFDVR